MVRMENVNIGKLIPTAPIEVKSIGEEAAAAEAAEYANFFEAARIDNESLRKIVEGKLTKGELAHIVKIDPDLILTDDVQAGAKVLLERRSTHEKAKSAIG